MRRYGATYANYVGTPLSYILATEERPDDADNPLRVLYGNEGRADDIAAFSRRFGCHVQDGYGSSENGVAIARTPDTPSGALRPLPDGVAVWRPGTAIECPRAETAPDGTLLNADEAIGELVNTAGTGGFSGYYNDPAADAARADGGVYRTGDLAYVDEAGYVHFAGRTGDWMQVGGENLGVAPIERALLRHPDVADAAVYGLPDRVGDQVAAALVLAPGAELDPRSSPPSCARSRISAHDSTRAAGGSWTSSRAPRRSRCSAAPSSRTGSTSPHRYPGSSARTASIVSASAAVLSGR